MKIYIMGEELIVEAFQGDGGNLTDEDIEAGYVGYVYYTVYDISDLTQVEETDGGMMLLTEEYDAYCKRVGISQLIEDVVKFAIGDAEYIVL